MLPSYFSKNLYYCFSAHLDLQLPSFNFIFWKKKFLNFYQCSPYPWMGPSPHWGAPPAALCWSQHWGTGGGGCPYAGGCGSRRCPPRCCGHLDDGQKRMECTGVVSSKLEPPLIHIKTAIQLFFIGQRSTYLSGRKSKYLLYRHVQEKSEEFST